MIEDKVNCFARIDENTCNALIKKECKNCKFYKHRAMIKNNPFYAYSYDDVKQLKKDINKRGIKITRISREVGI